MGILDRIRRNRNDEDDEDDDEREDDEEDEDEDDGGGGGFLDKIREGGGKVAGMFGKALKRGANDDDDEEGDDDDDDDEEDAPPVKAAGRRARRAPPEDVPPPQPAPGGGALDEDEDDEEEEDEGVFVVAKPVDLNAVRAARAANEDPAAAGVPAIDFANGETPSDNTAATVNDEVPGFESDDATEEGGAAGDDLEEFSLGDIFVKKVDVDENLKHLADSLEETPAQDLATELRAFLAELESISSG